LPEDDPKQRRPDIGRARQLLGWEPKISLEKGLQLSLSYFREAIAMEDADAEAAAGRGANLGMSVRG
jgi:hypothetical protein